MEKLKLLIIIMVILVIMLIGAMIVISVQTGEEENKIAINVNNNTGNNITNNEIFVNDTTVDEIPKLSFNTDIQEVTDNSILYALTNSINKYFNYIKAGNIVAVNELGGNNNYSITNNVKFVAKQAYVTKNENQNKYYINGTLTVANGDFTAKEQEVYMIMYVDLQNNTYKLETIIKEQFENKLELNKDEDIDIPKGTYNNFEYEYVDNVKQMEIYLEDYNFQIFNNTENAYNLLNEEYRNKRFGNINEFVKYVNEKQNELRNIKTTQYNTEEFTDSIVYKGTDEHGNYYHIIETAYMEYTIILDNYTMQDYSNASTKEKIEKSTEKFILMLNSADYTNAYNLLEETFKTTHFPTEQDFINYIKNNWYKRNIIASKIATEDGRCNVTIKETIATTSNKIQKEFKVNLGEGMEFTIEFNI